MARPRSLRVMISSRSNTRVLEDDRTLTECRHSLKEHVEAEPLFGERLFDVWIHEDAEAEDATDDAWEESLQQIRRADVVVVLYNGEAGWATSAGDVGICHAEMAAAMNSEPGKLYLIRLDPLAPIPVKPKSAEEKTKKRLDERFRNYVERLQRFHGRTARTYDELEDQLSATLRQAVAELAHIGVRESRRGRWASGYALDWSRLDYVRRKEAMEAVAAETLTDRGGTPIGDGITLPVAGREVYLRCHGVPAALTVAAAREMVGQPFLRDPLYAGDLHADGQKNSLAGPVHLILCHRGATEAQATRLLGFPDAVLVTAPFGVWVADEIQKVQLVLVANCRDPTNTRHGLQRFFEWLQQSGEDALLARRAAARARIVHSMAAEL